MYNSPFLYQNMYKPSIFSRLFRGGISSINWSNILNNTQKSLGIINQAIPLVYQIKPIVNNAKTMFKIAGAIKDDKVEENNVNNEMISQEKENANKPIFYI